MTLSVVYFWNMHRLGRPHYVWDEYLYSVLEKVEVRVTVSVTVCVVRWLRLSRPALWSLLNNSGLDGHGLSVCWNPDCRCRRLLPKSRRLPFSGFLPLDVLSPALCEPLQQTHLQRPLLVRLQEARMIDNVIQHYWKWVLHVGEDFFWSLKQCNCSKNVLFVVNSNVVTNYWMTQVLNCFQDILYYRWSCEHVLIRSNMIPTSFILRKEIF